MDGYGQGGWEVQDGRGGMTCSQDQVEYCHTVHLTAAMVQSNKLGEGQRSSFTCIRLTGILFKCLLSAFPDPRLALDNIDMCTGFDLILIANHLTFRHHSTQLWVWAYSVVSANCAHGPGGFAAGLWFCVFTRGGA